jgi:hypothetical protein
MTAHYDTIRDPVLSLTMPGCFVHIQGTNKAAKEYFPAIRSGSGVLCDILHGPNTLVDDFCPFENAFKALRAGNPWGPALVAFDITKAEQRNGSRTYDVLVAHALPLEDREHASFRLLPIPSSVVQLIARDSCERGHRSGGHVYAIPDGLCVRGVFPADTIKSEPYEPGQNDRELLVTARELFETIVKNLHVDANPAKVWDDVAAQYSAAAKHVTQPIRQLFANPESHGHLQNITNELKEAWEHPLDAPILQNIILPKIWDAIRNDRELRYLPRCQDRDQERLQYLRARLPLRELKEQDEYLHWLPLPPDEDHHDIRREMYDLQ